MRAIAICKVPGAMSGIVMPRRRLLTGLVSLIAAPAAGNAIVPQVAAEFIKATMSAIADED